jgi:hypothetical protein
MIKASINSCSNCGEKLKYYDKVKRRYFINNRCENYIFLPRLRCIRCKKIHRVIIGDILPYKHYTESIVKNAIANKEEFMYENEDYPCELTIKRWKREYLN